LEICPQSTSQFNRHRYELSYRLIDRKKPTRGLFRANLLCLIETEAITQKLVAMAWVTCWDEVRRVWMPADFHLGKAGLCRVMAGMRGSQTLVD
jgi:hypothetical protein